MSMGSTSPSKDPVCCIFLFNPVSQSVYMIPISLTEINTGLVWKAGRRFTKPMPPENRQE
jgi:hypothetical protein